MGTRMHTHTQEHSEAGHIGAPWSCIFEVSLIAAVFIKEKWFIPLGLLAGGSLQRGREAAVTRTPETSCVVWAPEELEPSDREPLAFRHWMGRRLREEGL